MRKLACVNLHYSWEKQLEQKESQTTIFDIDNRDNRDLQKIINTRGETESELKRTGEEERKTSRTQ